ncbi:DUF6868 family protein [Roseibium sp.]|uniref:DUF6868 family protein n=1 Tax=Roseibium sp. TaxID=1936156 RepID=UPI003A96C36E
MTLDQLTTLLGWCTLINGAILVFSTIALVGFRKPVARVHEALFKIDDQNLAQAYFRYLAQFKILVIASI